MTACLQWEKIALDGSIIKQKPLLNTSAQIAVDLVVQKCSTALTLRRWVLISANPPTLMDSSTPPAILSIRISRPLSIIPSECSRSILWHMHELETQIGIHVACELSMGHSASEQGMRPQSASQQSCNFWPAFKLGTPKQLYQYSPAELLMHQCQLTASARFITHSAGHGMTNCNVAKGRAEVAAAILMWASGPY